MVYFLFGLIFHDDFTHSGKFIVIVKITTRRHCQYTPLAMAFPCPSPKVYITVPSYKHIVENRCLLPHAMVRRHTGVLPVRAFTDFCLFFQRVYFMLFTIIAGHLLSKLTDWWWFQRYWFIYCRRRRFTLLLYYSLSFNYHAARGPSFHYYDSILFSSPPRRLMMSIANISYSGFWAAAFHCHSSLSLWCWRAPNGEDISFLEFLSRFISATHKCHITPTLLIVFDAADGLMKMAI